MNSAFCVVMLLLNIFCAFLSIKCGTFLLQFCGFGGAAAARRKNEREREKGFLGSRIGMIGRDFVNKKGKKWKEVIEEGTRRSLGK